MKIFASDKVREIDEYTIKNEPIESIDLMERASMIFVRWFMKEFDSSRKVIIYCGPGNNGGDGLAVARNLSERFYNVVVVILKFGKGYSPDFSINLDRLSGLKISCTIAEEEPDIPVPDKDSVIIDAIFGSGLTRVVEGLPAAAIKKINNSGAEVASIDIPSGLFGEDNTHNDHDSIIRADYTISFEFPFLSFFFPENEIFTGKWIAPSIGLHPDAVKTTESSYTLTDPEFIARNLSPRNRFSHKGTFGHALVIAGCDGMMGAAVLAVTACLRAGAGLVTAHVPGKAYQIIQTTAPEALVSIDQSDLIFTDCPELRSYNAVGVGPGLKCSRNTRSGLEKLLDTISVPLVIDADALNIISNNKDLLDKLPSQTILTPHPGEFDRLFGPSGSAYERHIKQLKFSKKFGIIIILKGAYTMVSLPDGTTTINNTGNPGMATGGSGDVLTGMITSLLAQGYSPTDASILGVYLHGLAADLALEHQSEESLLPGDINNYIGKAFKFIRHKALN